MGTILDFAKQHIPTAEIKEVAIAEGVDFNWLLKEVAEGRVVITRNINHSIKPLGIGNGLRTKINANIGTSPQHCNLDEEIEKAIMAKKYGADTIMDLSTGGNLHDNLKRIIQITDIPVGTVPIYAVAAQLIQNDLSISQLHPDDLFHEIDYQGKLGVDFMTLHCGVTKESLSKLQESERACGIVSRGGSILKKWIIETGKENPLYERYDELLEICKKYDITISLGDGLRPGAGADANDRAQIAELVILGELAKRAYKKGVQVMIEGPGHTALNQIETIVKIMKNLCNNAPLYVLGPLTIDNAPGYDHIVGAIGGALAAYHGANFLCYVTPAEHLCLPNIEDVKNGVIASKIAALTADTAKGMKYALDLNLNMSVARKKLNWHEMFNLAVDRQMAEKRKNESESKETDYCTMCGKLCAVKMDL
ncbi:MAG TPA: phosphomethylpyrimidine synthase ThiC [Bacteroidales bacterium]|nr:phosphomethylpyrimidine synthase ThiC [Bacteroidales bacterium]HOK99104.1 phosphomethylpyrimidine synthase ThiC [Bacteroidales bacterium]HPO65916.1 phosphomethylpyrimidine synthase ThiC [Bacteroidales bacterium]